ncbi:uncharacterized protein LOC119956538 isoform X1 [Scyliorhinus canicula]|uniref:uncharacterized protein LOC119956538 isoform X1 n=1 Tax=Scyliorhinus canicula TaxID=7830 RepID=UPI0018F4FDBD|nr:uncharacterized protein LOC119956538 isoform X1 [Scyliorhinus canicula]
MCPDDYYMDGLSMDCIPLDTGQGERGHFNEQDGLTYGDEHSNGTVPFEEVTSPQTLTTKIELTMPMPGMNHSHLLKIYIAIAATAFVVMVIVIVFIAICIQRHKAACRKVKNPVEAPEEFEKLNGCNLGNNGVLFQKNNSNSQALSGIFKNSVIMKVETGNENHPNACTVKASAENHILEYKCSKEREFAGFPLPATELGTTVLVTAKTIQTSN